MSLDRGDYMRTFSGGRFFPLDPRPEDFCIEDIAHALALVNRYCGHTPAPYSVGQHSLYVSRRVYQLDKQHALWGLLHDASEAYIADMPRPAKAVLPGYKDLEATVMAAICERFGLPAKEPAIVKLADNEVLQTEARDLLGKTFHGIDAEPLALRIVPVGWEAVERVFLAEFAGLAA